MLDPKSLKLFADVLECGTISAAAKREHIASAAISRRISDLEAYLGVKLVSRSNKGLIPTAAGRSLLDMSRRVLNDLESVRARMEEYAHGLKGHVRVFATMPAISLFLPSELGAFLKSNPQIQVHLEERLSSAIAVAVAENVADIGIMVMEQPVAGLEFHPYHEDDLVLVVAKSHPLASRTTVTFSETLDFDYVGLPEHSRVDAQLIKAASEQGKAWKSRIRVSSYDAMCRMAEAGLGIAVPPKRIAKAYAAALGIKVLKLEDPWAHRQLALCTRPRESLTPAAALLLDSLLSHVPRPGSAAKRRTAKSK